MRHWSGPWPTRRQVITLAVYALVLIGIVGGRGWFLARALGGRYAVSSLVFDAAGLAAIVALLRLVDALLKRLARRVVGVKTVAQRLGGQAVQAAVLLAVGFPFLIAMLVFHPLRIGALGSPRQWGVAYTDVTLVADGRRLAARHLPPSRPTGAAVLVTHGFNANRRTSCRRPSSSTGSATRC